MQLGHLLVGQVIIWVSLGMLVAASEGKAIQRIMTMIANASFLRVSDSKGVFCFLFSFAIIGFGFMLEVGRSITKINKNERMKYRIMKAQRGFAFMSLVLFINFISAYIFKSLNVRATNLLVLGLVSHVMCSMSSFLGMEVLNTFFYMNFVLSNIAVLLLTYILGTERMFVALGSCFAKFKAFSWF
ncbi:hypothetical protein OCOL_000538 [Ordospora colligata]|uniref:Uncharacterized protein n=1 Tax=Ordospora colligata OC4 TaxID=1354746 RepID=A0A0B2UMX7_9MICR|nr:uncharacterized protein M896_010700 [Ordospora colligata OC4]KHN70417.1 hypothetical protein M896_010700 [Ordospora colligata OC4]TBU17167.1 hypothetical protein CWI41_010700 [Ordospora colligata]TBU17417.1 hypothetical protein CWI40_010700 [Ordospora colligata]